MVRVNAARPVAEVPKLFAFGELDAVVRFIGEPVREDWDRPSPFNAQRDLSVAFFPVDRPEPKPARRPFSAEHNPDVTIDGRIGVEALKDVTVPARAFYFTAEARILCPASTSFASSPCFSDQALST